MADIWQIKLGFGRYMADKNGAVMVLMPLITKGKIVPKATSVNALTKLLPLSKKMHKHHVFPNQFRKWFASKGIDIDNYTVKISQKNHLKKIHGKGKWNQKQEKFIKSNSDADASKIFYKGESMLKEYRLEHLPYIKYYFFMTNISFINNNLVFLNKRNHYIVIDALYLMEVKKHMPYLKNLKDKEFLEKSRLNIFPYTDFPFAEYYPLNNQLNVKLIKKTSFEEALDNKEYSFTTDTGLIILLRMSILKEFILKFNYDFLVSDSKEIIDIKYWDNIVSQFNTEDLALIHSIDENDGVDIDGGGIYSFGTTH